MKKFAVIIFFLVSGLLFSAEPERLYVTGNIHAPGATPEKMHFTLAQLQALPQYRITTSTRWTEKETYTGPRVMDVLKASGVNPDATRIEVDTYDNFPMSIDLVELRKWNVILAYKNEHKMLDLRSNGPLWIMYPVDDHPKELRTGVGFMHLVWGLRGIKVD